MKIRGCFSSQFNEMVTILYEQMNIFVNGYTGKILKKKRKICEIHENYSRLSSARFASGQSNRMAH